MKEHYARKCTYITHPDDGDMCIQKRDAFEGNENFLELNKRNNGREQLPTKGH